MGEQSLLWVSHPDWKKSHNSSFLEINVSSRNVKMSFRSSEELNHNQWAYSHIQNDHSVTCLEDWAHFFKCSVKIVSITQLHWSILNKRESLIWNLLTTCWHLTEKDYLGAKFVIKWAVKHREAVAAWLFEITHERLASSAATYAFMTTTRCAILIHLFAGDA